jgi:serine phosphatase RsbU (regulator of sigma subunit)
MKNTMPAPQPWVRRPTVAIGITLLLLMAVAGIDYITGPQLDVIILYFLPVTYAAWSLGRPGAFAAAVLATIPTLAEQLYLVNSGVASVRGATGEVVVPFLIYLFISEVVYRLSRSVTVERETAVRLQQSRDQIEMLYERVQHDVDVAGQLQQRILAVTPPDVPGCDFGVAVKYARAVGGDFVDIGMIDGRAFICIADISGKGVPAALFTALLKHLLTHAHNRGLSGSAVVEYVNSAMSLNMPSDAFLTLFYAEMDCQSSRVQYINAGHPAGLVYRASTKLTDEAGTTTTVLGICGADSYKAEVSEIVMEAGDVLVLYTDGATESKTLEGEFIGDDLIRQLVVRYADLSAQDMAERIASELLSRVDQNRADDIAILCVKSTLESGPH